MIIYTSNLPNDQDMIKALGSLAVPIPIAFGDAVFWGASDTDEPIRVAVERKKLGDMVQCILNGRYLHQAQRAKEAAMDVLCLIVETGELRSSPEDGLLEVKNWGYKPASMKRCQVWEAVKPAITYSRFDQYLTELAYLAGIIVKRSSNIRETVDIIKALWVNFQTPPGKHASLKQIFKPPPPVVQLIRPSLIRRIASELDKVGWGRSGDVAGHFKSVRDMVNADAKEWASISGIGKTIAKDVVRSLGGD